jgi:hypothetical protein
VTDTAGNVVTSTTPGDLQSWQVAHVDSASNGPPHGGAGLASVSCPSVRLCVAVDGAGNAVISTQPAGGPSSWSVTHIDNGITMECGKYGPEDCQPGLQAVSCPGPSLCIAVDTASNVLTSTDPTDTSAWKIAFQGEYPGPDYLQSAACPSLQLCDVVFAYQDSVTTLNPSTGARSTVSLAPAPGVMSGIWCAPIACFTAGDPGTGAHGELFAATDPAGWTVTDRSAPNIPITGIACPTRLLCVATNQSGDIIYGLDTAGVRTLLSQLTALGTAKRIAPLLRDQGYRAWFDAPAAGRLQIALYRAASRRSAARPIATEDTRLTHAGRAPIRIKLTPEGRRLLTGARKIAIRFVATYTPSRCSTITEKLSFTIRR